MNAVLTSGRIYSILEKIHSEVIVLSDENINEMTDEEFNRQLLEKNPNAAVVNPALFDAAEKHPKEKKQKVFHKAKRESR